MTTNNTGIENIKKQIHSKMGRLPFFIVSLCSVAMYTLFFYFFEEDVSRRIFDVVRGYKLADDFFIYVPAFMIPFTLGTLFLFLFINKRLKDLLLPRKYFLICCSLIVAFMVSVILRTTLFTLYSLREEAAIVVAFITLANVIMLLLLSILKGVDETV